MEDEGGRVATKTTYKAYKCRLYPKPAQEDYFRRMFGCCRLVYNHFLEARIEAWEAHVADPSVKPPSHFEMCRRLTDFKRERLDAEGHPFLKDVDSTALVYELQHLDNAFHRFYRRVREGAPNVGFPRFKKRGDKDSATVAFKKLADIERNRMRFAKVGWVNAKCWRELEGSPVSCTVSVDAAGRWWASVLCKGVPVRELPPSDRTAAVDLSEAAAVPGDPQLGRRLFREKRVLSRRQGPGPNRGASKGWLEQKQKVGRLVAHERDQSRTRIDQLTSALVRDNGTIIVKGCARAKRTPQETELLRQLRYKCDWTGRELVER